MSYSIRFKTDGYYLFTTINNIDYTIKVHRDNDYLTNLLPPAIKHNFYEFAFLPANNSTKSPADSAISATIKAFIHLWLKNNPDCVLYFIFSNQDERATARNALFKKWFDAEIKIENDYELMFQNYYLENETIQSGFVFLKNNKHKKIIHQTIPAISEWFDSEEK